MRFSFLLVFIFTVVIGVGYWYQTTAYICPIPLEYRIGEVDPSFNLSFEEAKNKVLSAEEQWEESVNRDLFKYSDSAEFTVNFIFDERQAQSYAEERERRFLDGQLAENEELFEAVTLAQTEYEKLNRAYRERLGNYETRLQAYNQTVQQYNDRGGAPEKEYAKLEEERIALEQEANQLETTAAELNELANRINQLNREGNRLVDAYNDKVQDYNRIFGTEREFTQGDYQGDSINIYEFSSDNELQTVLLHEFGHALGIEHVEASSSVMYYLLQDVDDIPYFSADDLEAFFSVCGSEKEWDQQLRKAIRSLLSVF